MTPIVARPFVKWAGGKSTLAQTLIGIFPKRIRTYYEPFVGAGAVFFALTQEKDRCRRFVLNDTNRELIDTYCVIRDFPEDLMAFLREREATYNVNPESVYKMYRNPDATMAKLLSGPVERAGRFIFLNKCCFNGLYRVNKKGVFNVPWGKKPKVNTFDEANIRACAEVLNGYVRLINQDFEAAVSDAREGDLVYFDPPYVPVNVTSSFTAYSQSGFNMTEQTRLRDLFVRLAEKRVPVVLSNSDTPEVRELYSGWETYEVQAKRAINSKGDKRGPVNELIIVGRRVGDILKPLP
jgi:DNA adenine methylase